jgi:tetratricopeptide (TPR) repeat protein
MALCLPLAIVGCTTPDLVRQAPPTPATPPPAVPQSLTTNNQVAQVKRSDADKLKTKINILMLTADQNAKLADVGAAKYSPDGKAEVPLVDIELQKARFRDNARKGYQDVIALDPKKLEAYHGLTHIYLKDGQYDRALETINKALALAPRDADLLVDQATCHSCRKDWKQAENSLQNALEARPGDRDIRKKLGFTLAREGQFGKSVEVLSEVFHDVPGYAYYQIARMAKDFGQEQQCKEFLRLAIQTNPNLEKAKEMLFDIEHPEDPTIMPVQAVQPTLDIRTFVTEG